MKKIQEGDYVHVYFDRCDMISCVKIDHMPCATGDSWHLSDLKTNYVVNTFGYMKKLTEEEVKHMKKMGWIAL